MHEKIESNFRDGNAGDGNGRLKWRTAGRGDLIVDLAVGATPTRFHDFLAERFHVATLQVPEVGDSGVKQIASSLGDLVANTGHERCSVVVRGADLPLALQVLKALPGVIDALVLLAPAPDQDERSLEALSAAGMPVLVLSGTNGTASPPEAGSRFRARIRNCHYVLVYDAGDTIEIDRPEATASVIGDFLTRREHFIVAHASGLIHP